MEIEKVNAYIATVVAGLRHKHYERVTELAEKYFTYYTGADLDCELSQFTPREGEEMFEQRKRITKHIVTSIAWNVTSVERKIPRSNGITKVISYGKEDDKKQEELNKVLGMFWGTQSWDRYMEVRWIELNDIDPNTFVVFEWGAFDPKKELLQPYPFEVDSEEAVDFKYKNNILQYLTARNETTIVNELDITKERDGENLIVYLPNETVTFTEIWNDDILSLIDDGQEKMIGGRVILRVDKRIFVIDKPKPHNLGYVPAFRVGWKRDMRTKGATYLAPWHAALPFLEKIVKANSELDLTMALHAFPQKIITVEKCTFEKCYDGLVTNDEGVKIQCHVCKGSGVKFHTSAQDIITVPLPKTGEEQLNLENMIRYISPPIDILVFQDEYIDKLTTKCLSTVYNSDVFTRTEIATTATEKTIDLNNVYDALFPMSVGYAGTYKLGVKTIAKLIDRFDDLIVVFSFSKDFKFKTKGDYLVERKMAIDAQAPADILNAIDSEIFRIDTADDQDAFAIHEMKRDMNPFEGKGNSEINLIITANLVPKQQITLYTSYGFIFDEIVIEDPKFWNKNRKEQFEILYKKVDEITAKIEAEKPKTEPPNFDNA